MAMAMAMAATTRDPEYRESGVCRSSPKADKENKRARKKKTGKGNAANGECSSGHDSIPRSNPLLFSARNSSPLFPLILLTAHIPTPTAPTESLPSRWIGVLHLYHFPSLSLSLILCVCTSLSISSLCFVPVPSSATNYRSARLLPQCGWRHKLLLRAQQVSARSTFLHCVVSPPLLPAYPYR